MATVRLTTAQALVRYLAVQDAAPGQPFIAGVWAIFGHGNVAALGEALFQVGDVLPTWRGHSEQGMAHAAIAYAKASMRRRAMAVTTSIGPGALNLVTAAGVAHVNRLPVLFLPGDVFASRAPDPVLQQIEDFQDGTVSANDCLRPVSRYFDRITRPEQLLTALPRAMAVMIDPAECGPVTLAICQDAQAEAFDWPESFFTRRLWQPRRLRPDLDELEVAARAMRDARSPLVIAGGGVHYSGAADALRHFAEEHNLPVAETQAGKSALPHDHPLNFGSIGVTGASAANALAADADLVFAVGTRLQDFTTGSWALFRQPDRRILALNVAAYDAMKHAAIPLVADVKTGLEELSAKLHGWAAAAPDPALKAAWETEVASATAPSATNDIGDVLPTDAQVIGAVQSAVDGETVVVCAAGGLPGELHKLWRASRPGGYHLEYGFSCMGYEIAGGLGVKMARPDREVVVMVGDGSYMMLNSELATSVMLGLKIIVVLLDNHGYGCINRLQIATGGESFNNLLADAQHVQAHVINFAAHMSAMGVVAEKVCSLAELQAAMARARACRSSYGIVIETDPNASMEAGGHWWDVAIPEVSDRPEVRAARVRYETAIAIRRPFD